MVKVLEHDIVPQLEALGVLRAEAPDLTQPQSGEPLLALVFDREGWSPDCFRRLARRGIACITWHKIFKGADWPETDFTTFEVPIHGPAQVRMMSVALAEKKVFLSNRFEVRQIRRRLDSGRQMGADHHRPAHAHATGRRGAVLTLVAGELLQILAPGIQP